MATVTSSERKKLPRGRVQFQIEGDGASLAVHLDRKGFRRLLDTLERLAETEEIQTFDKSGRRMTGNGADQAENDITRLIFHIE